MVKTVKPQSVRKIERENFSRVSGTFPLPNLIEIQTESYAWFTREGIVEAFNDIFPIVGPNKNLKLLFEKAAFDEPKYNIQECKNRDLTFAAPLRVWLKLISENKETGEIIEIKSKGKNEVDGVYMGEFPIMSDSGTFIINGAERVIVPQIVRSPGAYYKVERNKSGRKIFFGSVIPSRGTWIEYETDSKKDTKRDTQLQTLSVRLDRTGKISASILLRALGLENNDDIYALFGDSSADGSLKNTLEKDYVKNTRDALMDIYAKLRPGEPPTEESSKQLLIQKFFDAKRYDLGRAGRFKFTKKLSIYNRLLDRMLAEDLRDANGKLLYKEGTFITKTELDLLRNAQVFEKGAHSRKIKINKNLDTHDTVQVVWVYAKDDKSAKRPIVGTDLTIDAKHITIPDILASFSYFLNIIDGFGDTDDIDHLGNRRIKTIGELLHNQFRIGLSRMERNVRDRMSISDTLTLSPKSLINIRPLTAAIKEFFSSSQLSQFMDQTNPLAELSNKRRISALGPGGLARDRAGMEVRDVHYSHYGRICPIETPEGQNIGLINNLSTYARVNQYGFIETPYRPVVKKNGGFFVSDDARYLSADDENEYVVAQANIKLDQKTGEIQEEFVVARYRGHNILAKRDSVDFVDVSPKQIVSVATACIPFLENDDGNRALMGANMQRQAIPLIRPHAPLIGTGMESEIARYSGAAIVSKHEGLVTFVDARKVLLRGMDGEEHLYALQNYQRSNQGTSLHQTPNVRVGDMVKKGDILADGPAMEKGDLALGQNVLIAFMTWNGYNYEDAVIMSERLVKEDVYTSIHIEEHKIESRETRLGAEEITRDIPNTSEEAKAHLDARGIVIPGAEVKEGDILVGKITPKGQTEPTPEEKLMMQIFGEKTKEGKDNSLRVPHGGAGIVHDVKIFSRERGDDLAPGVNEVVSVYIVQRRKISEGDKMAGRHGNKGVISRILPIEDMPYMADGTPVDIMLNPLGVPSRMNIGQVLELHLGMAAKKLGLHIATPVFDGVNDDDLFKKMKDAGMNLDGKVTLYDGRSGEQFDQKISVGVMYMIKLSHMVDDKLHARATGPYSLVTQQPLGGKAQNGGQRFGEMEVWALEAYGAAYTLQEMLTIKSDDVIGRAKTYDAILKGHENVKPSMPESFRVLQKELQSLAIDVRLLDEKGSEVDLKALAEEYTREEKRLSDEIRRRTQETQVVINENAAADEED